MFFTRQSFLAIVIAIVASGQAQADWQSWISGQSLKNLGKSVALELGRVFYKAPKCIYENTSKSEKVVGACALFGTVGTGYYFYKKYQNTYNNYTNVCTAHQNCDTKYNSLKKQHDNLEKRLQNSKAKYKNLKKIHQSCNAEDNNLTTNDFKEPYDKQADSLRNTNSEIGKKFNDTGSKPNSNNSPKSPSPVQSDNNSLLDFCAPNLKKSKSADCLKKQSQN